MMMMKTRIIYPEKLWHSKEFHNLTTGASLLAIYLVTNDQIGLIPYYECKDLKIMFDLKISESQLYKLKAELKQSKLFDFYEEWVFIKNDFSYCDYFGQPRVMDSKEKETNKVPVDISEYFKGLGTGHEGVNNLYINTKSKIINNNREVVKESDMQEIANKYLVPISFVKSKFDDVCNWEDEKPGRMKGRNWKLTLINWVKRDSLKIKQDYAKQNSDLAL